MPQQPMHSQLQHVAMMTIWLIYIATIYLAVLTHVDHVQHKLIVFVIVH